MADMMLPPPAKGGKPDTSLFPKTLVGAQKTFMLPPPRGGAVAPPPVSKAAQPTPQEMSAKISLDSNFQREQQLMGELNTIRNPDVPDLDKIPNAPIIKPSDPFGGMTPIIMSLAALAAGKTLSPATTMLNSFAEFNKARNQGDEDRAKLAHDQWKEAAQQVVDTNKEKLATYKEILSANSGDKRALQAELTALHAQDGTLHLLAKDAGGVESLSHDYFETLDKLNGKVGSGLETITKQQKDELRQQALAALPPEDQGIVSAIGEGRMLPSEIGRGKKREKIMFYVASVYGKDYDSGTVTQRRKYMTSFASPSQIVREQTLNSTIGHLTDLKDVISKMTNADLQAFNKMGQAAAMQLGRGSIYYQFANNRNLLMSEVAKLYKGGSPAHTEIEDLKSALFSAMSMDQLKGTLGQVARNLEDAGDAMGEVRANRTGESEDVASPYTGRSKERFNEVFDYTGVTGHHQMPKAGDVMDNYKFKGGDPTDQKNWEPVK